jgi:hypothetical protein
MIHCWHRPGRMSPSGAYVTCRHCGVLIDWCPCVGPHYRSVDVGCTACHGSMWVAVVRGRGDVFRERLQRDELDA